ncbi:MAG: response regulator transcription factor [Minwuiales bacterium]|nr:response regulator transcription factor [Minwuiales bacterium]
MKILIVEKFALVRAALCTHIRKADADAEFVEAASVADILSHPAGEVAVNLALVVGLSRTHDGLVQIRSLHAQLSQTPIVLLTDPVDDAWLLEAIAAGVRGLIPRTASPKMFTTGIRQVLSGEVHIPPSVMLSPDQTAPHGYAKPPARRFGGALGKLSRRQIEVLSLLAMGESNGSIAKHLNIERATVNNHVQAILKTLNVRNRTQAMLIAVNAGLSAGERTGGYAV